MRRCRSARSRGAASITIEALGSAEAPHPLQRAWVAHQVPQCGYCQSGMLMAAAALLAKNRKPSDADIDAAIANVCRCGTYPRLRAAIERRGDADARSSLPPSAVGRGPRDRIGMKRRALLVSGLGAAGALVVGWGLLPPRDRLGARRRVAGRGGRGRA